MTKTEEAAWAAAEQAEHERRIERMRQMMQDQIDDMSPEEHAIWSRHND